MTDCNALLRRFDAAKQSREPLEKVWRDCFMATYPMRGAGFSGSDPSQNLAGNIAAIMDGVGADSVRMLTSSIVSGMTPANSRWFRLVVGDKDTDEEKRWLDAVSQCLFDNIHGANFDAESYEATVDLVCAGWFCLFVDEDRNRGGLVFEQWPLHETYPFSTRTDGRVDGVFREYELTAEQAQNTYGEKNLSERTNRLAETSPAARVKFLMLIEPRKLSLVGGKRAKNLPFRQFVIEKDSKHEVLESGFHEFPVVVPRWFKVPGSCHAIGPLASAMPDVKMLEKIKQMHLASAEMTIAGMYVAEDDGVLNPRTLKVGPRKIIVANSVDSIKPLTPGGNWQLGQAEIKDAQAAIRKIMMADQLQPQDGPAMTATEVHVRVGLIRQLLGPIYGRLQAEYLQPLIERCFGLAFRAGVLTPPPESLRGRRFTVRYISPLARSAKLEDVSAIERFVQQTMMLSQVDPSVVKRIDAIAAMEILAEADGVPPRVMRTMDEYQSMVEQAQAAAAKQQQASMMTELATKAAPNLVNQLGQDGGAALKSAMAGAQSAA